MNVLLALASLAVAVNWNLTSGQIATNCKNEIARLDAAVTRLAALKGPRSFGNTLLPLENAQSDLNDRTVAEGFLFDVSTDKTVRDASNQCNIDQGNYFARLYARPDVYQDLVAVKRSGTAKTVADRKLLEIYLSAFRRSGAALNAPARAEFVRLSDDLNQLGSTFAQNLNNDASTVDITAQQAQSLPPALVATLKKHGDGYTIDVNESTVTPFLNNEADPAARRTYYVAYFNRALPNVAVLEKAIAVRDRLAHLLGYDSWAAYQLADRMAQTPQRVFAFEKQLDAQLLPRSRDELATLGRLAPASANVAGDPMQPWDIPYYTNRLIKTQYAVDQDAVSQYFPVPVVVDRIMNLYHKILGVSFVKVAKPNSWNDADVISYDVYDTKSRRFLGTTLFDFFPRPGKFTHFANFPIVPGRRMADGTYRPAMAAILGNWPRPAAGAPALLSHQDVVTFFHEFGHNLAALLATAPYETLSNGFRQDFIEAPSQMLENFMWQPSILKEISSNVKTGEPLPDDLIAKIVQSRFVNQAYFTTGQIRLGMVDMTYHTSGPKVDTTAVWDGITREYMATAMAPGTHPQASFGHLFGYDAGYYSYLWALVYAQDMFTAFQRGGLENPAVGMRYRKTILEPARTYEPDVEVRNFLGRPMNPKAFYDQILSTPQAPVKN
ncbi:MAG TPA: M3 family metallopeptidase [Candidatus Baltobacteraceae bacterium]|nr:M3 family metallopeptidase [Candidatus Baltobacteraceae bacterium]